MHDPKLAPGLGFYIFLMFCFGAFCWPFYGAIVIQTFSKPYDPDLGNTILLKIIFSALFSPIAIAPFICPLIGIIGSKQLSKWGL